MLLNKFISNRFIKYIYPLVDSTANEENKSFPSSYKLVPYIHSKKITLTHYGIMIPNLPTPHYFYTIMSTIGTSGALVFDTEHVYKSHSTDNATLAIGTAAKNANDFLSYSISKDCNFLEDGSLIQFGNDLTISGNYPHYTVHSENAHYHIDLELLVTDKVTWFIKTPIYDHISLLAQYKGTIQYKGTVQEISGLCTFEHAAAITPHTFWKHKINKNFKLPADFFTYQIINLDDEVQLLLNDTRLNGTKLISKAFIRSLSSYNQSFKAEFNVIQYQEQEAIAPDGNKMRLPEVFEWRILDGEKEIIHFKGTMNTPFNYGLGSGYVGGYQYSGIYNGKPINGQGYIEYIDRT